MQKIRNVNAKSNTEALFVNSIKPTRPHEVTLGQWFSTFLASESKLKIFCLLLSRSIAICFSTVQTTKFYVLCLFSYACNSLPNEQEQEVSILKELWTCTSVSTSFNT